MSIRLPRSLLWRLGLALMLAQGLAAMGLGVYAYSQLAEAHRAQTLDSLRRITLVLADRYRTISSDLDPEALEQDVRAQAKLAGVRLTVILPDGTVIADSEADAASMESHRLRPEVDMALRTGEGQHARRSRTLEDRMQYVAMRLDGRGDRSAVLRAAVSLDAADASFAHAMRLVGAAGAGSVVLTFAAVYAISRRSIAQVGRVADGAARFASGDLAHRIDVPATLELSRLATSLNHMAQRIHEQMESARDQQNEVQAILQSMSSGVIALDNEHRILTINRAAERLLGIGAGLVRGRLLEEAVRQPDIHRFASDAFTGRPVRSEELTLPGDPPRRLEASGEPLRDGDGRITGVLMVLNDVTHLRRLEAMRTDFAANVSHELRTPITNIKGYVETLLDIGAVDPVQTDQFLRIIKQNSDRLASIVEDVMALTRLEQPRAGQTLEIDRVSVASLVQSVAAQFLKVAAGKSIRLDVDVPSDLEAHIHAPLMEQAIGNLISNAINYSPAGTTVRIEAIRADDHAEVASELIIRVTDQGPGIAQEHQHRIFERFYRVDKGRSREVGGTGLGLAIVKHIMRAHGGHVSVESIPGRGSTFTLRLPVKRHADG